MENDGGVLVNVVNLINIVTTRGLPAIKVNLGDVTTLALLDSASGLNLIKKGVFDSCKIDKSLVRVSGIKVKGVNGTISKAIGEVNLWVEIMEREFNFLFVIIDEAQFPTDVLLGIDALRQSHLVTDWNSSRVWFADSGKHALKYQDNVHLCAQVGQMGEVLIDTVEVDHACKGGQGRDGNVHACGDVDIGAVASARLSHASAVSDLLHHKAGRGSTVGTLLPGDIEVFNVNASRSDLEGDATDVSSVFDSFVSLEDLEKVKIFVRKPVSVDPRRLVRVDFVCPTYNADEKVDLVVLNESCKVAGITFDSTVVSLNHGSGFCLVQNTTEMVKNIAAEVFFAEAYILSHGFAYLPGTLSEITNVNDRNTFEVAVAVKQTVDAKFVGAVKEELQSIDFPNFRDRLLGLLSDCRNSVAIKGDELGRTSLVEHHIELMPGTRPKYIPAYRMPHSRKEIVEKLVEEMVSQGVVSPSASPYNSPLILVPKKDGKFRPCVDFRSLNSITVPDRFPLPVLSEVLNGLGGKKVFSTLDLLSGFWQVPLAEESKDLTAFSTPSGHFRFEVMPFGLRNSPITFVRLMSMVFGNSKPDSVLTYLDDVVVYSSTPEEHLKDLEKVLVKLGKAGLKVKLSKCQFFRQKLSFLGHVISGEGIAVMEDKISKIRDYPAPLNVKSLKRFLGLCGYYRPFISNYATICQPLTRLFKKGTDYEWGEAQVKAFEDLKSRLISAPILSYPDFSKPFVIVADASDVGIGAALLQKGPRRLMPIAFASKVLSDTERRYSVTEREALGVTWALRKFRDICFGYKVTVFTDHQPVTNLFRNRNLTGKLARWFLQVQEFEPEIKYIPGPRNTIADALSRVGEDLDIDPSSLATFTIQEVDLDLETVRVEQCQDPDLAIIINGISDKAHADYEIVDGILYRRMADGNGVSRLRLCVPKGLVNRVLYLIHSHKLAGHPGARKSVLMAKRNYFWVNMATQIKEYVHRCDVCNCFKGSVNKRASLEAYPTELDPWEWVAMDFMGPLPTTPRGNRFLLVFVDYLSRWVELVPTASRSAICVAEALRHNVVTRHSCPRYLVCDNAREFTGEVLTKLAEFYGIRKVHTIPYRPMGNGLVERHNRKIIEHLRTIVSELNHDSWDVLMDDVAVGMNATVNESTGETPHYILYGYDKRLPTSLMSKDPCVKRVYNYHDYVSVRTCESARTVAKVRENLLRSAVKRKEVYDRNAVKADLRIGQKVFVLIHVKSGSFPKIAPKFEGPYRVIEVLGRGKYRLRNADSGEIRVAHWNFIRVVPDDCDPYFDQDFFLQVDDVTGAEVKAEEDSAAEGPVAARTRSRQK